MIRRDPDNEHRRISAVLRKQHWTSQDDVYKITRIADKDIVPTLRLTPLIRVKEFEEMVSTGGALLGTHGTGKHTTDETNEDHLFTDFNEIIDHFKIEELLGDEANKALNPLSLIMETWNAQRKAAQMVSQLLDQERLLVEELKNEQFKENETEGTKHREFINSVRLQEREMVNQLLIGEDPEKDGIEDLSEKSDESIVSLNRGRHAKNKILDEIEENLPLYGIKLMNSLDIYGHTSIKPPIDILQNEETIWSAYVSLPLEKRPQLERNVFPNGLPSWFMAKKFPFDRRQFELKKKEQAKGKRVLKPKVEDEQSWEEQMGFDY